MKTLRFKIQKMDEAYMAYHEASEKADNLRNDIRDEEETITFLDGKTFTVTNHIGFDEWEQASKEAKKLRNKWVKAVTEVADELGWDTNKAEMKYDFRVHSAAGEIHNYAEELLRYYDVMLHGDMIPFKSKTFTIQENN